MLLQAAGQTAYAGADIHFRSLMFGQFHAELFDDTKARLLEEFSKPDSVVRCLVSTVAFGMGIDIPDIRLIIHWGESGSVAQYWQEVGRAGRDGEPAEAHLYHHQRQVNNSEDSTKKMVADITSGICFRQAVLSQLSVSETPLSLPLTSLPCCSNCIAVADGTDVDTTTAGATAAANN